MRRKSRRLDLVALALASLLTSLAHANGRPPETNGVYFQPTDPDALYVRATFGLLISRDDGCSFRWVCEQSIGYGGTFDPTYALGRDGAVFATTFAGLRVSRDGGCSFTTATAELPAGAPGRIADIWVDALDVGPTGEVWAATAESGRINDVYRSTDGGVTFASAGRASPDIWWKSLRVAPSDAMHVYVTGYQVTPTPSPHLVATTDGGQTWTPAPLTGVAVATTPVIRMVAIDPANPAHVYVVSLDVDGPGADRLYRSTDAAATFTEVLRTSSPVANVVVSGTTVLVASGRGGTFRSDDGGASFAQVTTPRLGCLGQRPDGTLFGCGPNWDPDFMAVARSETGGAWQKIFRFVELAGPLACPAGTPGHDVCEPMWPAIKAQFGATGPTCASATDLGVDTVAEPPTPGGCCDAGDGAPLGLGLLTLVTAGWLRRRRR
ncbi:MAG: glycoside hydrolase [Myxococcota bacterium]|nr:glycoside hydrolase [Myxococcota bacterium]